MKKRTKLVIVGVVIFSVLIGIPSAISIISPIYCNSIYPQYCEVYSISLIGIGIPNFLADNTSQGAPTVVDPRIEEVTNGFAITANIGVFGVDVVDDRQAILLSVKSGVDGFISMDDPLPVLQLLFPERQITSFVILVDEKEIPYTLENGKLGFAVHDTTFVWIVGK